MCWRPRGFVVVVGVGGGVIGCDSVAAVGGAGVVVVEVVVVVVVVGDGLALCVACCFVRRYRYRRLQQ